MTDTWDLLHLTMEKVNDCLGDYWINQIEKPDSITEVDEEDSGVGDTAVNHDDSFDGGIQSLYSGAESDVVDDIFPQPRARSNTWPRRHLVTTCDTGQAPATLPFVSEEESPDHAPGTEWCQE